MRTAFLVACLSLTGACVLPRSETGPAGPPGLPVAAKDGAQGPVHLERVVSVGPDEVVLETRLRADGTLPEAERIVVDRRGLVQSRRREAAATPLPPSANGPRLPWHHANLTVRAHRDGADMVVELLEKGDPRAVPLARIPGAGDVVLGALAVGPGAPPSVAALSWTSRTSDIDVEGVAILDLVRGRARLALEHGLDAHRDRRFAEAARSFARALAIDDHYADAAYDLAAALAREGQPERALTYLGRALDLAPKRLRVAAAIDPDLDSLRALPAFRRLVGPGADAVRTPSGPR